MRLCNQGTVSFQVKVSAETPLWPTLLSSRAKCNTHAGYRELTDEDVRTAIKNSGGVKGSLLIPEAPFELLVRRAISRLLPSALQCQQFVHAELLRSAAQCAPADVSRFPALQVSHAIAAYHGLSVVQMSDKIHGHQSAALAVSLWT